jgi:hypothetical protein
LRPTAPEGITALNQQGINRGPAAS